MKSFDITCFGELLVDFTPHGVSDTGMRLFEQNAGGAPGNVAAALAKLGHTASFIGKVGDDINGRFLLRTMEKVGVNTSCLILSPEAATSMAFVELTEEGERDFSFVRDADTKLKASELDAKLIEQSRIFHFGSLSMTHEPALEATMHALNTACKAGCIISYDPNYRAPLWPNEQTAVRYMGAVLNKVDFLKVSEEEALLLTGKSDPEAAGRELTGRGPSLVAVTMGGEGAVLCTPSGCVRTAARACCVMDTTGAGDAFMGGMLSQMLIMESCK